MNTPSSPEHNQENILLELQSALENYFQKVTRNQATVFPTEKLKASLSLENKPGLPQIHDSVQSFLEGYSVKFLYDITLYIVPLILPEDLEVIPHIDATLPRILFLISDADGVTYLPSGEGIRLLDTMSTQWKSCVAPIEITSEGRFESKASEKLRNSLSSLVSYLWS